MSVLITRGSSIKALVCARSLGSRGVTTIVGDSGLWNPTSASRFVSDIIRYPSPVTRESEFLEWIVEYCKNNSIKVLLPTHSEDTYLIAREKKGIESAGTKVILDDYKKITMLADKVQLSKLLEKLDIQHPRTYMPENMDDVLTIAEETRYPAVIKPPMGTSSRGVFYAKDSSSLISYFKEKYGDSGDKKKQFPIVQEYVEGTGYGVSVLYNKGERRAFITHKRIREFPITGGPSSARVSVRNRKIEDMAFQLMDEIAWHGPAMVEFKYNEKTDEAWLIEVNPRLWGSLYQAVAAGVDIPYLIYTMALEGDIKPVTTYRTGVYTRYLLNDIRATISLIRNGERSKTADFLNIRKYTCDDLSIADPLPFLSFALYNAFLKFFRGRH